ncbi:MAG: CD3072 family TudS-related putative desulfidase [Candidatus Bathyarchaeaceae archaeon]
MIQDKRSRKIVVVAHCILNQNSRVFGIAYYPAMINEIVDVLRKYEVGIIQMPCPELTHAGLLRCSQTKEQYATPAFRRHCRQTASGIVNQLQEYLRNGFKVLAILGVDGSPTCGVDETSTGNEERYSPEPPSIQEGKFTKAPGILIEELQSELKERKVAVPMKGVRHARVSQDAAWLEKILTK